MRFGKCILTASKAKEVFFSFDVENELSIKRNMTISSKWNESGYAIDQAAAEEPIEISLSGKIGYIVSGDSLLNSVNEALDMVSNRLSIVQGSVLGGLIGPQAKAVQGAIAKAQTIVKAVDNFATKIRNEFSNRDRVADLYNALERMFTDKMLIDIDTPLETLKGYIITSFPTNYETGIDQTIILSITLKQVRFVELETTNLNEALFATSSCRADIGQAPTKDMGQAATSTTRDRRTSLARAGGNWGAL